MAEANGTAHMSEQKQTTKVCPDCGNTYLVLLRTMNLKYCTDCNKPIPWYLDPGQKKLI